MNMAVSPAKKLKNKFLNGIDQADSVTIDPHKGLFVPYPSSYILFKRRDVLSFFSKHPEETRDEDIWELGLITPFYGSRGFESLSLWMLISIMGIDGIAQAVEYRSKIAKYTEELIENSGFFIKLNKMDFYRMAFVYCPNKIHDYLVKFGDKLSQQQKDDILNLINKYDREINQKLYKNGEVCLDKYSLFDIGDKVHLGDDKKFLVMAITVGNPLYTEKTMKLSLDKLFNDSKKLVPLFEKEFLNIIDNKTCNKDYCHDIGGPAGW